MGKLLNQMTKAELLAIVQQTQSALHAADALVCQLSNDLTTERRRRLNEGNGYREIIAKQRKTERHVPPSADPTIPDDLLTQAQRAIRAHRAAIAV